MSSNSYGEYTSLEDLQFKLEKHRDDGAAVSLETLKLLEESHHVKAALESYDGISQLSDYVDIVELGRRRRRPQPTVDAKSTVGPDTNLRALARIVAAEAAEMEGVAAFRREVLRGRLLKPHRVAVWIKKHKKADGPPTSWVTLPWDTGDTGSVPRTLEELCSSGGSVHLRTIRYGDSRISATARGGVLDRLRVAADQLVSYFEWEQRNAVHFILAGEVPPISRARVQWAPLREPFPALRRVVLDVSPRLSPEEVKRIFVRVRNEMGGGTGTARRSRPLTPRHADLAVFVAERKRGWAWHQVHAEWNRTFPYRPTALKQFIRDARAAYKRITGDDLDWKGRSGPVEILQSIRDEETQE